MQAPYTLYAGGYEQQIVQLSFDPALSDPADRLKIVNTTCSGNAPTWLTVAPDGKTLLSTDEWGDPEGAIELLKIGEDGRLEKVGQEVRTGASLHLLSLDPATPSLGTSYTLPVAPDHSLGPHPDRQQQAHPHGATPDPLQRVLVVPDLGTDELRLYGIRRDAQRLEDALTEYGAVRLEPGCGPRHVLFSPLRHGADDEEQEARLYVMNELDNSLSVLRVTYPSPTSSSPDDPPTFTPLQSRVSILPAQPMPHQSSFSAWHSAELVLSPCGRTLIASNRAEAHDPIHGTRDGPEDLLAVFAVGDDGRLDEASRELVGAGGRAPRHISLSSESATRGGRGDEAVERGRYLAVALHDSDEVVVLERRGAGGRQMEEVARATNLGRPGVVVWL
ncbi:hypothetical protein Rhopal_002661-T1 [Rhodotorula paludigena]|uniref:Lactonase, 7-bladed beta-propeller-domain-containing protein n=1 Tax=Rhodotorula paludigena TaxID=86838 RepID=A0AAV5GKD2_9BASI|nr:hypothetical protein Rhopal_002661-T1 [Rhodotorula paludigena]